MFAIINADTWMRAYNRKVRRNTRAAARLANESLRRERRSSHRWTWWI